MDLQNIAQLIQASFEDARLDKQEKQDIVALLSTCDDDARNYARNIAFDITRDALIHSDNKVSTMSLHWLERVIKALNQSAPSFSAEAYFSPGEECRKTIIGLCKQAQKSIDVCVFTISDNNIRDALIDAHKRGINVRIVTDNDKSEDRGSDVETLASRGIATRMDTSPNHMHHKYAIFDGKILLNGSFNWTRSATDRNEENITVLEHAALIAKFQKNFEALWREAEKF